MAPPLVVFDFDSSITTHDTSSSIALSAVSAAAAADRPAALGAWKSVLRAYVDDPARAAHVAAYRPAEAERTTVAEELAFLDSHRPFDLASARRCASSGLFKHLPASREQVRQLGRRAAERGLQTHGAGSGVGEEAAADKDDDDDDDDDDDELAPAVRIRQGFHDFVSATSARGCRLGLLSISFSLAFLEGVLGDAVVALFGERCANDIQPSTGEVVGPGSTGGGEIMTTPGDKMRALRVMREHAAAGEDRGRQRLVYIGDSTTDLGCVAECADLGIVMVAQDEQDPTGGDGGLMRCLRRLGFEVPHVSKCRRLLGGTKRGEQTPRIVWARDFNEILQSDVLALEEV